MAFDLIIWKWTDPERPADPDEILEAIAEDDPHPALTRFDTAAFESAIRSRFRLSDDGLDNPFSYDISDFKDVPANWMTMSISWGQVESVYPQIIEIAHGHDLAVFDPQSGEVR